MTQVIEVKSDLVEFKKQDAVLKAMTEAGAMKLDELCEPAWGFDLVDQFVLFAKMMNERVRSFVR
jgi:hypothetical protein